MTQAQLERELSRATGESRETIRRHGFSILPMPDDGADDEPHSMPLTIVDWDEQDGIRRRAA